MFKRKPKVLTPEQAEEIRTKDFFDCILPGTVKFMSDHYILGDSYRCVWVIREYPPSTEEQAILSQLADRSGVTLRIYHRLVESIFIDYDFLESESVVLLEQLRTVDKKRLSDYLGKLSQQDMRRVEFAMAVSLGMRQKKEAAYHE